MISAWPTSPDPGRHSRLNDRLSPPPPASEPSSPGAVLGGGDGGGRWDPLRHLLLRRRSAPRPGDVLAGWARGFGPCVRRSDSRSSRSREPEPMNSGRRPRPPCPNSARGWAGRLRPPLKKPRVSQRRPRSSGPRATLITSRSFSTARRSVESASRFGGLSNDWESSDTGSAPTGAVGVSPRKQGSPPSNSGSESSASTDSSFVPAPAIEPVRGWRRSWGFNAKERSGRPLAERRRHTTAISTDSSLRILAQRARAQR